MYLLKKERFHQKDLAKSVKNANFLPKKDLLAKTVV